MKFRRYEVMKFRKRLKIRSYEDDDGGNEQRSKHHSSAALCSCLIYQTLPDESGDYNSVV